MKIILGYVIGSAILTTILYAFLCLQRRPAKQDTPEQKKASHELYEMALSRSRGRGNQIN